MTPMAAQFEFGFCLVPEGNQRAGLQKFLDWPSYPHLPLVCETWYCGPQSWAREPWVQQRQWFRQELRSLRLPAVEVGALVVEKGWLCLSLGTGSEVFTGLMDFMAGPPPVAVHPPWGFRPWSKEPLVRLRPMEAAIGIPMKTVSQYLSAWSFHPYEIHSEGEGQRTQWIMWEGHRMARVKKG